jgi:CHASE2 domain-containing sensor protein
MLHIRRPLARAVRRLSAASPRVVALDVILADAGDPAETRELSCALGEAPNPVLSCELVDDPLRWEDPRRSFPAGRSTSVTSMRNPMIAIR